MSDCFIETANVVETNVRFDGFSIFCFKNNNLATSMTKEGPSRTLVRLPKSDDKDEGKGNNTASYSKSRSPASGGPSPAEELLKRLQGTTML